jgi:chorismate synthase
MAGNTFGAAFRVTTFGESHGAGVGVVVDGCPAGVRLDEAVIQRDLDRRRPGVNTGTGTSRSESDKAEILSGVFEGRTTGTPIAILIRNTNQHSADYEHLRDLYRPGHADFTFQAKYGFRDHRGGGRSSGRETAGRVAGGAVAKALLQTVLGADYGATAFTLRAAGVSCATIDYNAIDANPLRAADPDAAKVMEERILALRERGDSAGGIVECRVAGLPAGLGEGVFDKLDALIAQAMVSLGAVKGIEFGAGFAAANMTGSEMNDGFFAQNGQIALKSNKAGGVLGGMSTGDALVFRVAVKPVPSIAVEQQTVRGVGGHYEDAKVSIKGRHDGCICPRLVPVVEAMTHLVIADLWLRNRGARI